jgi:hypothetical protein
MPDLHHTHIDVLAAKILVAMHREDIFPSPESRNRPG